MSPTGKAISARPRMTIVQRAPENGNVLNGETKAAHDMTIVAANPKEPESEEKPQKSLNDKQQENQDLLIKCISQDLGFPGGKPVAACVICKCLPHWRSFEVERSTLFDCIIQTVASAIQAPRTSRASLVKGHSQAIAVAQQALIAHWQSIVKSLDNYLKMMKANFVPPFLVRKVFTQIFSFINVQLFNSLLLRRECCSFSNGEYVKAGLAELEQWCCYATEEYVGLAWDELKHIRQAVGFLVIHQKQKRTLNEITTELCPVLSIQQLYRISTMYWDDKYGTPSVSSEFISSMRVKMTEDSNNAVSSSFLLDDN